MAVDEGWVKDMLAQAPPSMSVTGEVSKSHGRFLREGFYERFIQAPVLDIGSGPDPLFGWMPDSADLRRWDRNHGDSDAAELVGVEPYSYGTVWASHILEHMDDPVRALHAWWRTVRIGGHLVVAVPHRELYERSTRLPSRWSREHKHFYLPNIAEPPVTRSFTSDLFAAIPFGEREVVLFRTLDEGYQADIPLDQHPAGEYSIQAVIRRKDLPA